MLHLAFMHFRVSEMYFNSSNFTFLLSLFPFQCRFFSGALLVLFYYESRGDHVRNSRGKIPGSRPLVTALYEA